MSRKTIVIKILSCVIACVFCVVDIGHAAHAQSFSVQKNQLAPVQQMQKTTENFNKRMALQAEYDADGNIIGVTSVTIDAATKEPWIKEILSALPEGEGNKAIFINPLEKPNVAGKTPVLFLRGFGNQVSDEGPKADEAQFLSHEKIKQISELSKEEKKKRGALQRVWRPVASFMRAVGRLVHRRFINVRKSLVILLLSLAALSCPVSGVAQEAYRMASAATTSYVMQESDQGQRDLDRLRDAFTGGQKIAQGDGEDLIIGWRRDKEKAEEIAYIINRIPTVDAYVKSENQQKHLIVVEFKASHNEIAGLVDFFGEYSPFSRESIIATIEKESQWRETVFSGVGAGGYAQIMRIAAVEIKNYYDRLENIYESLNANKDWLQEAQIELAGIPMEEVEQRQQKERDIKVRELRVQEQENIIRAFQDLAYLMQPVGERSEIDRDAMPDIPFLNNPVLMSDIAVTSSMQGYIHTTASKLPRYILLAQHIGAVNIPFAMTLRRIYYNDIVRRIELGKIVPEHPDAFDPNTEPLMLTDIAFNWGISHVIEAMAGEQDGWVKLFDEWLPPETRFYAGEFLHEVCLPVNLAYMMHPVEEEHQQLAMYITVQPTVDELNERQKRIRKNSAEAALIENFLEVVPNAVKADGTRYDIMEELNYQGVNEAIKPFAKYKALIFDRLIGRLEIMADAAQARAEIAQARAEELARQNALSTRINNWLAAKGLSVIAVLSGFFAGLMTFLVNFFRIRSRRRGRRRDVRPDEDRYSYKAAGGVEIAGGIEAKYYRGIANFLFEITTEKANVLEVLILSSGIITALFGFVSLPFWAIVGITLVITFFVMPFVRYGIGSLVKMFKKQRMDKSLRKFFVVEIADTMRAMIYTGIAVVTFSIDVLIIKPLMGMRSTFLDINFWLWGKRNAISLRTSMATLWTGAFVVALLGGLYFYSPLAVLFAIGSITVVGYVMQLAKWSTNTLNSSIIGVVGVYFSGDMSLMWATIGEFAVPIASVILLLGAALYFFVKDKGPEIIYEKDWEEGLDDLPEDDWYDLGEEDGEEDWDEDEDFGDEDYLAILFETEGIEPIKTVEPEEPRSMPSATSDSGATDFLIYAAA
ncbi:hypothetical protein ACFL3D_01760 [Candidatus Omnitrophota bacterium]